MGRRRPRAQASAVETVDFMPVSARIAWSYLAGVFAAVGAGLLVVISNQTLAAVACAAATGGDDPVVSCKLGYAIWTGVAGFVLCLIPAVLALKLDWWLWAAMLAGLEEVKTRLGAPGASERAAAVAMEILNRQAAEG